MEIDKKRLAEQQKIVQKWVSHKGVGTVVGPTGFGKSYIGILTVQSMNNRYPDRTTIIIVPTQELKNQWNEHILSFSLKNVEVLIINSAIKKRSTCHLLILDEVHRYAATTFKKVFSQISYKFIQGLTATFEREDKKHYIIEEYSPVIYKMSVKEAKKKSYISEFDIFNLAVHMTDKDRYEYDKLNDTFNYYFSWFEHDFHRVKLCLNDNTYANHYAAKRGIDVGEVKVKAVNFFRTMGKRKRFLYGNNQRGYIAPCRRGAVFPGRQA